MPLPAIPFAVGLGTLIGSAFAGLVGFLTAILGKKAAIGTALAAFLVAGWIALQAGIYALWLSLGWTMPAELEIPVQFVRFVLPANTALCIEIVVLAKIGRWLWDGQRDWARATAAA